MDCTVADCQRQVGAKGMCYMHYERWKRHGHPDLVQPQGLPLRDRFERHVDRLSTPDGCHEWTAYRNQQGYGQFAVNRGGGRYRTEVASRVAWELYTGERPASTAEICHHCDNPPCVRREHLYLGSTATNAADRERRGRGAVRYLPAAKRARGERSGRAKLSDEAVRQIRHRYAEGDISQQALADEYGVSQSKISDVIRRATWRHVS